MPKIVVSADLWEPFIRDHIAPDDHDAIEDFLASVAFLIDAIEQGAEGKQQALAALRFAFDYAYRRTPEHSAALKLAILSKSGYVQPDDELLTVLTPAIERSEAEKAKTARRTAKAAAAKKAKPTRKRKGTRKSRIVGQAGQGQAKDTGKRRLS